MRKLTIEQKEANKIERERIKKLALIESEKNQPEVKEIKINIEWHKSRTWGNNPVLDGSVWFKNGSFERFTFTCSGCGYDKESTVIANLFNAVLKYKLYRELPAELPYGIYIGNNPDSRSYSGGIGVNCYYRIADAIGGKFECVASGKTFDCYKYTDN
jgi:hypothetical protein